MSPEGFDSISQLSGTTAASATAVPAVVTVVTAAAAADDGPAGDIGISNRIMSQEEATAHCVATRLNQQCVWSWTRSLGITENKSVIKFIRYTSIESFVNSINKTQ